MRRCTVVGEGHGTTTVLAVVAARGSALSGSCQPNSNATPPRLTVEAAIAMHNRSKKVRALAFMRIS